MCMEVLQMKLKIWRLMLVSNIHTQTYTLVNSTAGL